MFKRYLLLFLWFVISVSWAEVSIPELSKRVTDLTATLTAEQTQTLEDKLAAFEARKGSQIAVLLLPTTQPETIEAYSIRVAEAWKIGRKDVDDGVILLIAKDDKKLRLEIGRGLEGVIPDAIAKRVLAETIKPHFKSGDFFAGIDAGVTQVISLIDGEKLPEPTTNNSSQKSYDFDPFVISMFFISLFIDWSFSALMGRGIGTIVGLVAIVIISIMLAPVFALKTIACVVAGVSIFLVLKVFTGFSNSSGGNGWRSGSGGSSWSSGSSSSWSGGGGDFGGGGASDSW